MQNKELVEFDVWFAMRKDKIPPQHMREIIKADFKGQKVGDKATLEVFDAALKKYGVKLSK